MTGRETATEFGGNAGGCSAAVPAAASAAVGAVPGAATTDDAEAGAAAGQRSRPDTGNVSTWLRLLLRLAIRPEALPRRDMLRTLSVRLQSERTACCGAR